MKLCDRYNRKGFTLVEALLAMVILSIVAASVILPFSAGASVQAEGWKRTLAAQLAADLIEQIKATDFDDIDSTWSGYSESAGQIKDSSGTAFTNTAYSNLSRDVTIAEATLGATTHYWVTVRVYDNGREMVTLSALIGP